MTIQTLWAWVQAHALAVWPLLSAVLILVFRTRTPAEWVALGERSPRLQGLIRFLRGAGFDPSKTLAGLVQLITGRAPPSIQAMVATATPEPPDLARQLYEAYGDRVGWRSVTGAQMPAWGDLPERIRDAWGASAAAAIDAMTWVPASSVPAPVARPSRAPSGRSGEAGRATAATLVLLALVGLAVPAAVVCCGPRPPPSGPGAVVSSWSDTARTVLSTLSWAIPSARAILNAILPEPARTIVGRALDAVAEAATRLAVAVEAYESRGGDRCAAHAAVGGVRAALVQLAQVLADNGVALGTVLERVADGAASIADALVPSCNPDAGWASTGDRTNAELRAIERSATARGVVLRRDLDGLRP